MLRLGVWAPLGWKLKRRVVEEEKAEPVDPHQMCHDGVRKERD